ncbi:MAG: class I SAM-dependent methyltransferase [Dehalococcoidales bacterium]|nr:MAG: class I SAM-dependent methyltransferase [Dehalococcoidales bacterium]
MENRRNNSQQASHPGGDTQFWQDERVQKYDYQQQLLSEKKEDVQANITRIVNYFCQLHSIGEPKILDVGCGPGTPMTLSSYILDRVPRSILVGVDSSEQMVEAAKGILVPKYGNRFSSFVSDFNSDSFWMPEIDSKYDFIVSSGTLHYLSDKRTLPFMKEIFNHIKDRGVFVSCMGSHPTIQEIAEMVHLFRVEFTYNQLEEEKRPREFPEFKKIFEETDRKANVNWRSSKDWLGAIQSAGFRKVDIVWHLWVRSIYLALA